jgi:hypothetical protein
VIFTFNIQICNYLNARNTWGSSQHHQDVQDWRQNFRHNNQILKGSHIPSSAWYTYSSDHSYLIFIPVEWYLPLVAGDWILPWRLRNSTPLLQAIKQGKKLHRLNMQNLHTKHFMIYSCEHSGSTDISDEVSACRRKPTTLLILKNKRSHEFFHEWRSEVTTKKSVSYTTMTTNISLQLPIARQLCNN